MGIVNFFKQKYGQWFGQITVAEMQGMEGVIRSGNQPKIRAARAKLSKKVKNCKSVDALVLAGIGVSCVKVGIEVFSAKITERALVKESLIAMVLGKEAGILGNSLPR